MTKNKTPIPSADICAYGWKNREKYFTDGKECVIFNNIAGLTKKIDKTPAEQNKVNND